MEYILKEIKIETDKYENKKAPWIQRAGFKELKNT